MKRPMEPTGDIDDDSRPQSASAESLLGAVKTWPAEASPGADLSTTESTGSAPGRATSAVMARGHRRPGDADSGNIRRRNEPC